MEKITIERNEYGGFTVRQGDRFAELAFEEALATVCALMMQNCDAMPQRFINWMKTEEEEKAWRESLHRCKDEPLFEECQDS